MKDFDQPLRFHKAYCENKKGICDLAASVDTAQAVAVPEIMLDFFIKLVIIKYRIFPCEEYRARNVLDRASFIHNHIQPM